jgi:hypothetical protein
MGKNKSAVGPVCLPDVGEVPSKCPFCPPYWRPVGTESDVVPGVKINILDLYLANEFDQEILNWLDVDSLPFKMCAQGYPTGQRNRQKFCRSALEHIRQNHPGHASHPGIQWMVPDRQFWGKNNEFRRTKCVAAAKEAAVVYNQWLESHQGEATEEEADEGISESRAWSALVDAAVEQHKINKSVAKAEAAKQAREKAAAVAAAARRPKGRSAPRAALAEGMGRRPRRRGQEEGEEEDEDEEEEEEEVVEEGEEEQEGTGDPSGEGDDGEGDDGDEPPPQPRSRGGGRRQTPATSQRRGQKRGRQAAETEGDGRPAQRKKQQQPPAPAAAMPAVSPEMMAMFTQFMAFQQQQGAQQAPAAQKKGGQVWKKP